MAKLRTNHRPSGKQSSGMIVRVGLFGGIIAALFYVFNLFTGQEGSVQDAPKDPDAAYYIPTSTTGTIIQHQYYTLSYAEAYEQAEWVAYKLTKKELSEPWLARNDDFRPDPNVPSGSATPQDYRNSGYDRGHLVPVADRAFNEAAMSETFYMSNMSPQARNFNGGIWRELEEQARYWAKRNNELYVVSGPVLTLEPKSYIGENKVAVPAAFFKVLLDIHEPQTKGIGFVIPNEVSYDPLFDYAVSIDDVEELTGLDFFGDLIPAELEEEVEADVNIDLWPFSKKKFEKRIEKWNKQ
jgi:endonuclease G